MFVELVALALGVIMLVCGFGRLVAQRSRRHLRPEHALLADGPAGRLIGTVTSRSLDALPLIAPEGAGYGVATRLLIQAAREEVAPAPLRRTRLAPGRHDRDDSQVA